jgi:hypothetical protein
MQALGALPPRQRVALVLRYFEDLSEADAAEAMGCSVGTVKSTTSRALERLRSVVEVPEGPTNGNGNGSNTTIATSVTYQAVQKETCVLAPEARTNEGSITS